MTRSACVCGTLSVWQARVAGRRTLAVGGLREFREFRGFCVHSSSACSFAGFAGFAFYRSPLLWVAGRGAGGFGRASALARSQLAWCTSRAIFSIFT